MTHIKIYEEELIAGIKEILEDNMNKGYTAEQAIPSIQEYLERVLKG